jgi:hypothetical protein
MAKFTNKSTFIPVRVEPELREAIKTAAEEDRRPMASLVRIILEDWVSTRAAHDQHASV